MRLLVLDRYVVRELVSPFVFGGTLFTFFLLIDRIYHLTDLVITKGVPFYLVVQLLVFMLPSFMTHTLPMALLVAVLLAGGRLAGDLEIVAFKSAGVSPLRLFRPILLAGLVVTTTTALLTLVVNPLANREFQRQLFQILQTRAVSGLQERLFNATFGDVIIYVEEVSASQVALRGLLVSDERNPRLSRIVTALRQPSSGDAETSVLRFDGGRRYEVIHSTRSPKGGERWLILRRAYSARARRPAAPRARRATVTRCSASTT